MSSRRRLSHPLPANFFQCPSLSQSQKESMIQMGVQSLKHLVLNSRLDGEGPFKWNLEYATPDLQVYVGSDLGVTKDTVFLSVTELHATLDEAASLFRCETTEEYEQFIRRYNKDVIDCAALTTLAPPTEEYPRNYIGLKWFAQETPIGCKNRDFCVIECCDDFVLHGTKGWGRVQRSIDLPWVPSLYSAMGIVRGRFHDCGTVFLETDTPGVLRASQIFHVDLRGSIPKWVIRMGIKKRARTLAEMDTHFRARRMMNMTLIPTNELIPRTSRRSCQVCQTKFAPLQDRISCRQCGEVVCAKCSKWWDVPNDAETIRSIALCSICSGVKNSETSRSNDSSRYFLRTSSASARTQNAEFNEYLDDRPSQRYNLTRGSSCNNVMLNQAVPRRVRAEKSTRHSIASSTRPPLYSESSASRSANDHDIEQYSPDYDKASVDSREKFQSLDAKSIQEALSQEGTQEILEQLYKQIQEIDVEQLRVVVPTSTSARAS